MDDSRQYDKIAYKIYLIYTQDKKVARARDYFYHGQGHLLVYTERVHFFRRFRIKGIGHILFYQLPQYPHFYAELCNFIQV